MIRNRNQKETKHLKGQRISRKYTGVKLDNILRLKEPTLPTNHFFVDRTFARTALWRLLLFQNVEHASVLFCLDPLVSHFPD